MNFRCVRENQPIEALSRLRLEDQLIYNERELKHMQDVQNVYQMTTRFLYFTLGLSLLAGLALAWQVETRPTLLAAFQAGGLLAAGLITVIGVLAIVALRVWRIGEGAL